MTRISSLDVSVGDDVPDEAQEFVDRVSQILCPEGCRCKILYQEDMGLEVTLQYGIKTRDIGFAGREIRDYPGACIDQVVRQLRGLLVEKTVPLDELE